MIILFSKVPLLHTHCTSFLVATSAIKLSQNPGELIPNEHRAECRCNLTLIKIPCYSCTTFYVLGAGSIIESLTLQKPLVVVVNQVLMNNHQTELAQQLHSEGYLLFTSHTYVVGSMQVYTIIIPIVIVSLLPVTSHYTYLLEHNFF